MISNHFDVNKCEIISEITYDGLSSYSVEELCFIKKGVSEQVDKTIKQYYDSREQFESIRCYLSNMIQTAEKKSGGDTNQFIKIHETSKSEDLLIGTSRRITLLKSVLPKTSKVLIDYVSKYSQTKEIFEFNLSELEYKPHGSNKTNLIITSPEIRQLTSIIQDVKEQLIKTILSFYNSFIELLIEKRSELHNISDFVRDIDIVQCRCYIAYKYNYCKPVINKQDKAFIDFKGLRHCLIEHILTKELYVTNDLVIGNDYNGFLIYGTNAVGKTSLIRAIGISLVMASWTLCTMLFICIFSL